MVVYRSGPLAIEVYLSFYLFGQSRECIGVRLDGGDTVSSDRVPFVLVRVALGEDLCRLLCVHINRSGLTGEKKKEKMIVVNVRPLFLFNGWRRVKRVYIRYWRSASRRDVDRSGGLLCYSRDEQDNRKNKIK